MSGPLVSAPRCFCRAQRSCGPWSQNSSEEKLKKEFADYKDNQHSNAASMVTDSGLDGVVVDCLSFYPHRRPSMADIAGQF